MHIKFGVDTKALRVILANKEITSIQQLSDITGVDRNTVSKVLRSEIRPSTSVIERFICGLDIDSDKAGLIFFVPILTEYESYKAFQ